MLGRIGVTLLNTGDMSMADIASYAQEAEALGYEGFWSTEGDGKDPFMVLAIAANATRTIKLGTSIASYYSRTPTLLAIEASTLYRMSGKRFLHFGIGTGGVYFTERGHGVKIEKPLARAQETTDIIRGLLTPQGQQSETSQMTAQPIDLQDPRTSQRFHYNGQLFNLQNFRLMEGPLDRPLPIYFSAIGPKMVALAARIADGIVTNSITEEGYERYQTIIQRESEAAGRNSNEVKLYSLTMMAVEDDMSMDVVRRALTFFFSSAHYYPMMEVSGYGAQALRIQQAWRTGKFVEASSFVTDEMVEKFAVVGSAEQRKQKLRWMLDRDIYPILYPIWRPGHVVDDYLEIIRLGSRYLSSPTTAVHV